MRRQEKIFPAFFFVAEKDPRGDIPTEGFFYPAGFAGACPAIRVKRDKNAAKPALSLFLELGIINVKKESSPSSTVWRVT